MPLKKEQINELKIIYDRQKKYPSEDLRAEYYTRLSSYGISYGDLALGVVRDKTFSGQIANYFLDSSGITSADKLILSKELFLKDFEARQNLGDLSIEDYREYHRQVYSKYGIDLKYWTPEIPIQILGNKAGEILFSNSYDGLKIYDLYVLADESNKIKELWRWLVKAVAATTETDQVQALKLISLRNPKFAITLTAAVIAARGLDYFLPYCFTAETPILMADGIYKPIAEIKIGDEVMAFEGLGEIKPCKVIATSKTVDKEVVKLGNIKVTPNHQFLLPDGSFKSIKEVNNGDYLVGVTGKQIPHPGIQLVPEKHTVYNITVEGLHTYIAGDYRVHNDCIELGDIITNREVLANGTVIYTGENRYGSKLTLVEQYDPITRQAILIDRTINFVSGEAAVTNRWSRADGQIDDGNNVIGEPEINVEFPFAVITGEQIGAIFGSTIGQSLAGENAFAQIGAGSALGTLLSNVGETLHIYFNDSPVLDIPGSQPPSLEQSAEIAFNKFGEELFAELKAQSISAVSSFLVAELSEALNVGNNFGGQLFNTVTGSLTRTLITNALNTQAPSLFTGLGPNIVTSVSGFLGSYLANEILSPNSASGALGGSIGGAIGSTIGFGLSAWGGTAATTLGISVGQTLGFAGALSSWGMLGNIILPGIGALVGTLVGTLLGDWIDEQWGDEARAWASLELDSTTGQFFLSDTWRKEGGNRKFAVSMAEASRDTLNNYLELLDGTHIATDKLYHRYGHREEDIYVNFRDELHGNKELDRSTPEKVIDLGVIDTLKRLRLAGGDLILKRAIEKTVAKTIEELNGDLQIAQDYARYQENKDVIDLLIALEPNSAFSAGWVVTLVRAEEMGITDWSKSDFYGGVAAFFESYGLDKTGATLDNLKVLIEGTTLKLEVIIDGEVIETIALDDIENKIGYKQIAADATGATVNGTPGNDIWIAQNVASTFIDNAKANDGESSDILIGGSGNDTIQAGLGWDFVQGNDGKDLIIGGAGNDALLGGNGDDTLYGDEKVDFAAIPTGIELSDGATSNAKPVSDIVRQTWFNSISNNTLFVFHDDEVRGGAGKDQIAGGEGNDRLFGDAGNDTLYGDAGNDLLEGGDGADVLYGGAGYDAVSYASATSGVTVDLGGKFKGTGSGGDQLYSIEDIIGSDFSDTLKGDAFANIIDGGGGADTIDGRGGRDAVSFFSQKYGVEVDLSAGKARVKIPATGGGTERVVTDTLVNIEDVIGSRYDDTLKGSVAGGLLDGSEGNDIIQVKNDDTDVAGGAAPSDIRGGEGFDTLSFAEWSKNRGVAIDLLGTTPGHKISSIEKVIGSQLADTITGTDAAEIFEGGKGNDVFDGKGDKDVFLLNREEGHDLLKSAATVQTGLNTTVSIGSEVFSTSKRRGESLEVNDQDSEGNLIRGEVRIYNGETIARKARFTEKVIYGANTDQDNQDAQDDQDAIVFEENITYHDIFGSFANADPTQLNLTHETYFYNNNIISKQDLLNRLENFDLVVGVKSPNSYIVNPNTALSNFNSSIRIQGGGDLNLQAIGVTGEYSLSAEFVGYEWVGEGSNSPIFKPVKIYQGKQYSFDTSSSLISRLGFENSAPIDFAQVKYFKDGSAQADTLTADAGKASWLYGGSLNDNLTGSDKGDILVGGTSDDKLQGGAGDDQYAYWLGDGQDIITDLDGADTIVFGGGIGTEQIKLKIGKLNNLSTPTSFRDLKTGEFQGDLKIEIYDSQTNALSGSITVVDFQSRFNAQDRLRFAGDIEYTFAEFLKNQDITILSRYVGTTGDDNLTGGEEAEEFFGLGGNDTMRGGDGDDIFFAHLGADKIYGDDGSDTVDYEFASSSVAIDLSTVSQRIRVGRGGFRSVDVSTPHVTESENVRDELSSIENARGSAFDDTITGSNSDNILMGRSGHDSITANDGDDTLDGGKGNDTLVGDSGNDLLLGGDGNDSLIDNNGNNSLEGGLGNDIYQIDAKTSRGTQIQDSGGTETLTIANINLTPFHLKKEGLSLIIDLNENGVFKGEEDLTILDFFKEGGTGKGFIEKINDVSTNTLLLHPGFIAFSSPNYTINENGTPVIAVTLTRSEGNDGAVSVTVTPSNGTAIASSDYNNAPITVNFANKQATKTITIPIIDDTVDEPDETFNLTLSNPTGGARLGEQKTAIVTINDNDVKVTVGGNDGDLLFGGDGDNSLDGKNGDDVIFGGNGDNTLNGGDGNDILFSSIKGDNIFNILFDKIKDNNLLDILDDKIDDNTLDGENGGGNNIFVGGQGNDTLSGGIGSDRFTFNSPTEGIDIVKDFDVKDDLIVVSSKGFGAGLVIDAAIAKSQFVIGTAATTAFQRFIYNSSNGALFFDPDGSGGTTPTQLATLSSGLALTNDDFLVMG